ncbi:uncharacterized protein EDB91DRAFT_1343591 [Suillus paluster]|uniref:uncharacterized protein n=1 Tax=Suillus paluster TaxID=48578 RepID=UPI001B86B3BB|nr:uncharacterized protein EDB91DRAFT_1343591 [Suillus paluster]KAG1752557.1 hypothetical protein EDB91DRAFT_1343591 [Suillus paluster]
MMLWSISNSFWISVRLAIPTMQPPLPTSHGPALKAIFKKIDSTASLFHDAPALRPQGYLDHPLSLCYFTKALNWRYDYHHTPTDIRKSAWLYNELLTLSRGHLSSEHRSSALNKLSWALDTRFTQCGGIDDLDESIRIRRDVMSLLGPEEWHDRGTFLNNLALSISWRFNHQGKSHDLDEAISLYEEALRLWPVGHEYRGFLLDNLGDPICACFRKCGDINDINRAINLLCEALTLRPPGDPTRGTTLNNLATALQTKYHKLHTTTSKDLNDAIDSYRESLRSEELDRPERHRNLINLSLALRSCFTQTQNEDAEEAICLGQESLVALPPLHPERHFSCKWLKEAYLSRYEVQCNPADLSLALENFRLASRHPTQSLPACIVEAYN